MTEPFGMAALLFRQLLLFYQSSTSQLHQHDSGDDAGVAKEESASFPAAATCSASDSRLSQILQGFDIPGPVQEFVLRAVVVCSFVLPVWGVLLSLKVLLGYNLKRFALRYNWHYDRTFKRIFKAKK
jgi:hypothetical protein